MIELLIHELDFKLFVKTPAKTKKIIKYLSYVLPFKEIHLFDQQNNEWIEENLIYGSKRIIIFAYESKLKSLNQIQTQIAKAKEFSFQQARVVYRNHKRIEMPKKYFVHDLS